MHSFVMHTTVIQRKTAKKKKYIQWFCFRYRFIPFIFIPKIMMMIKIKHEEETTGTRSTSKEEIRQKFLSKTWHSDTTSGDIRKEERRALQQSQPQNSVQRVAVDLTWRRIWSSDGLLHTAMNLRLLQKASTSSEAQLLSHLQRGLNLLEITVSFSEPTPFVKPTKAASEERKMASNRSCWKLTFDLNLVTRRENIHHPWHRKNKFCDSVRYETEL
jgi:hypothetical protein